jgi:hypothetical protein
MFAFNPTVQDRSGELIAQGMNNAATMQLQGMQSLGESLSGLGKNIADSYSKAADNKITSDYLDGLAGQFAAMKRPDGRDYMDAETLEKYSKAPLGKKQGIITGLQAQADYDMKRWMYETQYTNTMSRINQTAANQAAARQVPPNQVPMPSTGTSTQKPPVHFGTINTNPQ